MINQRMKNKEIKKDLYEKETKKSAISKSNSLNYKYIDEAKQIDSRNKKESE